MVATKHVTDGRRRFVERFVIGMVILVHSVENTSVNGLETVTHVGQSTRHDYRHRVLNEGVFDLLFHSYVYYFLFGKFDGFVFVVSVFVSFHDKPILYLNFLFCFNLNYNATLVGYKPPLCKGRGTAKRWRDCGILFKRQPLSHQRISLCSILTVTAPLTQGSL